MENKYIYLIILTRGIGGAGNRFTRLFSYFQSQNLDEKHNIRLVMNKSLYTKIIENKQIHLMDKNIILRDDTDLIGINYKLFFLSQFKFLFNLTKNASSVHLISGSIFFVSFFKLINAMRLRNFRTCINLC